jgi:pimeloyl-ACP methyl ester carboxylesterase
MNGLSIPLIFALCTGADLVPPQHHVSQPLLVVLIGGFVSDPSPGQVNGTSGRGGNSGLYRLRGDLLRYDGIAAEYFNWNGTRTGKITATDAPMAAGIAAFIRERQATHPHERLVIVGNSWGGHTAREVCELLAQAPAVPVELMIFLDPSSLARVKHGQRPGGLPANVQRSVNYFTRHFLSWRHWSGEPRVENVDLGDPANGFCTPGGPPYDSLFDHRGHVCAEWDERIHRDIRRRIRQLRETGRILDVSTHKDQPVLTDGEAALNN